MLEYRGYYIRTDTTAGALARRGAALNPATCPGLIVRGDVSAVMRAIDNAHDAGARYRRAA